MLSKGIFNLYVVWGYVATIADCVDNGGWVVVMMIVLVVLVLDGLGVRQGMNYW